MTAPALPARTARFDAFRLDIKTGELRRHDRKIPLQQQPFQILVLLLEHAGEMVTRDEIRERLWSSDTIVEFEHGVATALKKLRQALGDHASRPRYVETLTRRGYRWLVPVSWEDASSPSISPTLATPAPPRGRLVGRDGALATLGESLRRALQSERQIVLIDGEAGIGKTALVDEFERQVAGNVPDLRIARGQCIEDFGDTEPYYPALQAVGELCHTSSRESVVAALAQHAPTWLVQFPALLTPERREVLQREILGATRQRMVREICDALEAMASTQPLMLVFEDLHWVDPSTVDLISALARRRSPAQLILLGTSRPVDAGHPLNQMHQDLVVHRLCQEILLDPLTEQAVVQYLSSDSTGTPAPAGLARLVYQRSEGNPLFIVAALDNMTRTGLISHEEGAVQLRVKLEEVDVGVPETLGKMIEAQIERLSAEEQRVLEVASVAGVSFSPTIAAAAIDVPPEHFEEICDRLSRRQRLLRAMGVQRLPDGALSSRYEFVHALYREVLYGRQASGRRTKWHQRIGEMLESHVVQSSASEPVREGTPELAYHFEAGGDWTRAVKYLRVTAEMAGQRYAPHDATSILEHALDLLGRLPDAERAETEVAILQKLAAIYVVSFDPRVVQTYETLIARAAHYGLVDVEARALIGLAYPVSWISASRCLDVVERALELGEGQSDPISRARTRASCLVRRIWAGGWNARDAEACRNALTEIRLAGERRVLAAHLVDCNFIQWASSEYRDARRNAVENLGILLEGSEDNPYLSFGYWLSQFILPWSLLFLGEWGDMLRELEAGIAVVDKNGDMYRAQTLRVYQAWLHLQAMDFAGVLAICDSVLPMMGTPERTPWRRFCLVLAGSAEAASGSEQRALDHLSILSHEMNRQPVIHDWYSRMLLESALTELSLVKGDLAEARRQADQFLSGTLATAERTWQALAWEASARVAVASLDWERAHECIGNALAVMEGFETPLAAWRVHATAADLAGQAADAKRVTCHRQLSQATILGLANSLPSDHHLRTTFVSSPLISRILVDPQFGREA